jgi:hypothetical protein
MPSLCEGNKLANWTDIWQFVDIWKKLANWHQSTVCVMHECAIGWVAGAILPVSVRDVRDAVCVEQVPGGKLVLGSPISLLLPTEISMFIHVFHAFWISLACGGNAV